ncbi:MAG: hypothetical protein ACRDF7_03045 [Candidatus Limnocylindrales bacterium]
MTTISRATTLAGSVLADPGAWLLGTAAFVVRGGIVLLVAPIWTAPSPVGIAVLIGPRIIDTERLTGAALVSAYIGAAALVVLLVGAVLASAWLEAAAFDRVLRDKLHHDDRPGRLRRLAAVQALALVPVALAALVAAAPIADAVRAEILMPTDLSMPLVLRAARAATEPLAILVASIVLAEALNGWLSRRVLWSTAGGIRSTSPVGALRAAASTVSASVTGWLLAGVVLSPAVGAVVVAWDGLRRAWLDGAPFDPARSAADIGVALATVLFVAVWVAALLLGGIVSALRGALWTARALPNGGGWTAGGD